MMSDASITAAKDGVADINHLIEFLKDRDAACPQCQYNLRNLTSSRCPECGREVQLGVTLVEPDLRPWIGIMVSVSAAAGVGLFWCAGLIFGGPPPRGVLAALFMQIVAIPAVPILVAKRRAFMKWSIKTQSIAAVGAVLYFLVSMTVILAMLILRV